MIAWSHSRLETFENCPYRFEQEYVVKAIKDDTQHPAAAWGLEVHKAMEYGLAGADMPDNMKQFTPYLDVIKQLPNSQAEVQMAITTSWEPTDWYSGDAWGRAIADVLAVDNGTAAVVDYKTGKYRGATRQPAINALLVFSHYPQVTTVLTSFVYFKEAIVDAQRFERADIPTMAAPVLDVLAKIGQCESTNRWPRQPSGLCAYCPVKACQYNRT